MTEDARALGARLRKAREYLRLTQSWVARELDLPRPSISLMESGKQGVPAELLSRLATIYQRKVAWFLGEDMVEGPELPAALRVALSELSEPDRAEVLDFAEFLAGKRHAPQRSLLQRHRGMVDAGRSVLSPSS